MQASVFDHSRYKSTYQCIRRIGKKHLAKVQPHPINTDTKDGIESIRTNGVSVSSELNLEKM